MLDHGPESKQSQQTVIGVRECHITIASFQITCRGGGGGCLPRAGRCCSPVGYTCQRRFDCGVMPAVRTLRCRDPYIGVPADAPVGVDEFRRAKSDGDAVCHCQDDAAALRRGGPGAATRTFINDRCQPGALQAAEERALIGCVLIDDYSERWAFARSAPLQRCGHDDAECTATAAAHKAPLGGVARVLPKAVRAERHGPIDQLGKLLPHIVLEHEAKFEIAPLGPRRSEPTIEYNAPRPADLAVEGRRREFECTVGSLAVNEAGDLIAGKNDNPADEAEIRWCRCGGI